MCVHIQVCTCGLFSDKRILGTILVLLIKVTMHVCHQEWKINCNSEDRSILLE